MGYRLRLTPGVTLTAATYGGGTYGGGTWGQEATDPLDGLKYTLIPWPVGYPVGAGWDYKIGDELPDWHGTISSSSVPIDQTAITTAQLVLDRVSPGPVPFKYTFDLVVDEANGRFSRTWEDGDLVPEGIGLYRPSIRLVFDSARQLTVTAHADLTLRISESNVAGLNSGGWLL